ncbi:hypothetical protein BH24ACI2_BH24ACI2_15460 [soil metagenome]
MKEVKSIFIVHLLGFMANRFDVVSVRVKNERSIVIWVIGDTIAQIYLCLRQRHHRATSTLKQLFFSRQFSFAMKISYSIFHPSPS